MKVPVRKCYHIAKVSFFIILVVSILSLFEQWRGGKRSAQAHTVKPVEDYESEILIDEARIIPGLGEGGVAAHLVGDAKRLGEESEKKLAINVYLSDRIAYNRTLKDHRNPACQRVLYDAELPSVSVILIFHNEPYSVVIRTIWSVINSARRDQPWYSRANYIDRSTGRTMTLGYPGQDQSSPFVYLKEIILVDDNSTLPELKGKLSHYIRTRLPPDLIKVLRLPDRVGLTRARLAGARYAKGDVVLFLDAHCETQQDWLRPLLQRIKDSPHAVVVPIIDVIEATNFYYSVQDQVAFQGLMRARIRGARAARGDVLIFLDAHCETGSDWLRPLLQRISHKRDAVITPLIDVVDQSSFQLEAAQEFQVGGFTFMGHFTWIDIPEREKKRRGSDIAPTWSPTMAGGLFAINRQYYWELGAYDEQMAGWGGENLEMSFRIWQCGGTLETIPCSRVGHVFRSFHPYGLPAHTDTHGINTARMAEVWMDEYAELFYLHRPDLRNNPKIGDVTHRKILREKLKCKSFQWYLDNIYTDKFVPVRDVYGFGRIRSTWSGLCADTLQREGEGAALGAYPCHARLEPTQYFALSSRGQLRDEEKCAELQYARRTQSEIIEGVRRRVLMVTCHDKQRGQKWRYNKSQQLQHVESGLCLTSPAAGSGGTDLFASQCKLTSPDQRWLIDYNEDNGFRLNENEVMSEQELRLQKLRGQRRISRSLLSYENKTDNRRSHHHKRKKRKNKKSKDKFILKLVRTINNTEEHLEADVYCKHMRLYPNNSFVRDIVAVLNDRDIKVINNGRMFDKHKVFDMNKHTNKLVVPQTDEFEPKQVIHPKKRKEKKRSDVSELVDSKPIIPIINPINSIKPINVDNIGDENTQRESAGEGKKIIIEDFVEIKPSGLTTHSPKRKRKRVRNRGDTVHTEPFIAPLRSDAVKPIDDFLVDDLETKLYTESGETSNQNKIPIIMDHKPSPRTQKHKHSHNKADVDFNRIEPRARTVQLQQAESDETHNEQDKHVHFKYDFDNDNNNNKNYDKVDKDYHRYNTKYDKDENNKFDKDYHRYNTKYDTDKNYDNVDKDYHRFKTTKYENYNNKDSNKVDKNYVKVDDNYDKDDRTMFVKVEDHHATGDLRSDRFSDEKNIVKLNDPQPRANDQVVEVVGGGKSSPVRVVLRSNLTFNLGEEFFNWKRAADDVANLLGELTIPTNVTKSAEIDSRQEQETVPRASAMLDRTATTNISDEASGTSESTSEEN